MRKTIQCPLLYLIVIHLVAVIAIVAIVAPWFGFRLSKVRVDVASGVLVENGWWGEDWTMSSGSDQGSGWFNLGAYLRRYVRVIDASGETVVAVEIDRDGHAHHVFVSPPGLESAWSFSRTGRSSSGWSLSAWIMGDGERIDNPYSTFHRFTQYRDMNASGMPTERHIRTAAHPAPRRTFQLKADAWEEYFRDPPGTTAPATNDDASEGEPEGSDSPEHTNH